MIYLGGRPWTPHDERCEGAGICGCLLRYIAETSPYTPEPPERTLSTQPYTRIGDLILGPLRDYRMRI